MTQATPSPDPTGADREWSSQVASHYTLDELSAMSTWLDTNIALNQARLEAVTNRLGLVLAVGGIMLSVLTTATSKSAWPITLMAALVTAIAAGVAVAGLRTSVHADRDPTSTYKTLWGSRAEGEVLVVLYRRRSVLFRDQRNLIESRATSLRCSAWMSGIAVLLTAASVLVSNAA